MDIIDPGHKYKLSTLDGEVEQIITFVKREGDNFPGNIGHYPGVIIQEVLRVLIDRLKYLDNQRYDVQNEFVLYALRKAIWHLEVRAARIHNLDFPFPVEDIEMLPVCKSCGHIVCNDR